MPAIVPVSRCDKLTRTQNSKRYTTHNLNTYTAMVVSEHCPVECTAPVPRFQRLRSGYGIPAQSP
ncbi:hypothetical protein K439DRAFT_1641630 [Ramaria rubella]|nr:hypothetical protein K439DRAFT_1641630 [Ramaria rubella]